MLARLQHEAVHAQLTKLNTLPEGKLHPNGAATGGVIQEGYTVKGYYIEPPRVGHVFDILRYERNGVKANGIMTTSLVKKIDKSDKSNIMRFETENSLYELTSLPIYEEKEKES